MGEVMQTERMAPTDVSKLARLIFITYLAALFCISHMPLDGALDGRNIPLSEYHLDKIVHCFGFAGLTVLAMAAHGPMSKTTPLTNKEYCVNMAWLCGAMVTWGMFDELTQPWFGRTCEMLDWVADVVGVAVGLLVVFAIEASGYRPVPRQRLPRCDS